MNALAELDGLITADVGEVLRAMARDVPADRAIVEIGSYKGKSTAYLADGARGGNGARVYAIDPWEDVPVRQWCHWCEQPTFKRFADQLASVGLFEFVQPIRSTSARAAASWNGPPIGLLYIDGAHDYRTVFQDLTLWLPHLHSERFVAVGDYGTISNPDVRRAVDAVTASAMLRLERVECGRVAVLR